MQKNISAIILGAGKESTDQPYQEKSPPTSLLEDQYGSTVLKWILNSFKKNNIKKIYFVGGYEIEKIGRNFPDLEFIYNANWAKTGVLESLYHARNLLNGPVIVSYGDIVYTKSVIERIINNKHHNGTTIAYDSTIISEKNNSKVRKNIVRINNNIIDDIGFLPANSKTSGEFIGLAYFDGKTTDFIKNFYKDIYSDLRGKAFQQADKIERGYLTDLLRYLKNEGLELSAVDIKKNWAEINNRISLAKFVMGTKSDTLERLMTTLTKGKLCNQYTFYSEEWHNDSSKILNNIKNNFNKNKIAIRSSSFLEDSFSKSNAGAFKSVLNLDIDNNGVLIESINDVIDSYKQDSLSTGNHQVLVQEMVQDVMMSGVVLTRDMNTGAEYYIVSYDDTSKRTDTVTSGTSTNISTVLVNKSMDIKNLENKNLSIILQSIVEIEEIIGYDSLDIEFAMNKNHEVYILQVRPIASLTNKATIINNKSIFESLHQFLERKFASNSTLFGKTTIYSDMTDWNPAEMIGSHPKPLAFSMYNYLIMDSTWRIARGYIGYNNPNSCELMVSILGHAFVDVRASFNNLTPASLPPKLFEKLINYYLEMLKKFPEKHDKVEFEILFTCLDFLFDERSERLLKNGFNKDEISILKKHLLELTNKIISGEIEPIDKIINLFDERESRSKEILNCYKKTNDLTLSVKQLLDDCITYGTIPFSVLARYAFIANSLLRSLVEKKVLKQKRLDDFLNSIDSVATELVDDLDKLNLNNENFKKNNFIKKYGHLRPGTYDISSKKYGENFYFYFVNYGKNKKTKRLFYKKEFILTSAEKKDIDKLLEDYQFSFEVEKLFEFAKRAISLREFGKFEFSKNISSIFDLIIDFGQTLKIDRDELAYLNIHDIIDSSSVLEPRNIKDYLNKKILENKELYTRNKLFHLPNVITSPKDINCIKIPNARPNYVTQGKVSGQTVFISNHQDENDLLGKIILIEGADPGYDWIFTHNILGLITKYGGSASHMTIRANEFNLPAAIGCGDNLFSKILSANIVELNCEEKYINVY